MTRSGASRTYMAVLRSLSLDETGISASRSIWQACGLEYIFLGAAGTTLCSICKLSKEFEIRHKSNLPQRENGPEPLLLS